jgi:hypothetical protein
VLNEYRVKIDRVALSKCAHLIATVIRVDSAGVHDETDPKATYRATHKIRGYGSRIA